MTSRWGNKHYVATRVGTSVSGEVDQFAMQRAQRGKHHIKMTTGRQHNIRYHDREGHMNQKTLGQSNEADIVLCLTFACLLKNNPATKQKDVGARYVSTNEEQSKE